MPKKYVHRAGAEFTGLNRRRFMGLTSAGLFGTWAGRLGADSDLESEIVPGCEAIFSERVLVIGAGISGLAAARRLKDAGFDVLILESRERIGGRIETSSHWSDAPVDLGASWIHGTDGNPIAQIAESIDAPTVATHDDKAKIYDADGRVLSQTESHRLEQLTDRVQQIIVDGQDADLDRPLRQTVQDGIGFEQLSLQDQRLVNFIIHEIEQDSAGSAQSLSTYWFDQPDVFTGSEVVFPSGYRAITDHLATGLAIELGHTVREVSVGSDGVTVTSQQGVFAGNLAIVTLPLGVLKSGAVQFSPKLPAPMLQAIDSLKMGILNKAYLRFPSTFWPGDLDWIQQVPGDPGEWLNWVNMSRVTGEPILVALNAADFGRNLESWTDQEIVADGVEKLRGIFGNAIPDPVDFQITRWGSDPHTLGSYSYIPAGAHPSARDALAGSLEDRVFFAGEATHRQYYPTVHGAYLSGLAAADRVLEAVAEQTESSRSAIRVDKKALPGRRPPSDPTAP